ncbi:MAG: GNAT family N-acetyltransferase [Cytophagales bacterium]|nr:MAG: GNAT family N-acetyltransferase [Cytophagales bacterium]
MAKGSMSDIFEVIRYKVIYQNSWNDFVSRAQNTTFLFHRNFMDYHSDRFEDYSAMIYSENELIAIFPANKKDNKIYAHAGLTYGSLAVNHFFDPSKCHILFNHLLHYYHKQGFGQLIYKEIPVFYQENRNFSLFLVENAGLYQIMQEEDIGAVIDLQNAIHFWHGRWQNIKKAEKLNLSIITSETNKPYLLFKDFWEEVLVPNLKNKYNLLPTHTLDEIALLASRFPTHIKQYNVYYEGKIIAGTTIFEDKKVAHCQYIASTDLGKSLYATDFLFHHLITQKYKDFNYFSFGISNEHGSKKVNEGLLRWKMSWGAQVCKHNHFFLQLDSVHI